MGPQPPQPNHSSELGMPIALQHKNQIWMCDMEQGEVSHDVLSGYHLATNVPYL
jgi:hypothetical protein